MITRVTKYVKKAVTVNGVKHYDMYERTKVSFLGIPLYKRDEFRGREKAL